MAKLRPPSGPAAPADLLSFNAAKWGDGDEAVRTQKRARLAWLAANPGRGLPIGRRGDVLGVLQDAVRLLGGFDPATKVVSECEAAPPAG